MLYPSLALLSSVVLSTVNQARGKARDARRIQDINALVQSLALYASDNNGNYPTGMPSACVGVPTGQTCWGDRNIPGNDSLVSSLSPYISSFPTDPLPNRGWGDRYLYLNGSINLNCGPLETGTFIAFRPDSAENGSVFQCPATTLKACCGSGPCGNDGGYYCAKKVNN